MDFQLTKADQDYICRYSYLITRKNYLLSLNTLNSREAENHKDSLDDLEESMLLEEGTHTKIKVGNAFIKVPNQVAKDQAQTLYERAKKESQKGKEDLEQMEKEMSIIKKLLTEKFGNAIRLE
jgi:chaperonin cofactor prefoldin